MTFGSNQGSTTFGSQGSDQGGQYEGKVTRAIETRTREIPSVVFLGIAGGAVLLALGVKFAGNDRTANFIGQWVPTVLLLGLYNKLVKEHS